MRVFATAIVTVAVIAAGVVGADAALGASAQWLLNGTPVLAPGAIEATGKVVLSDTKLGMSMECSSVMVGSASPAGAGQISEFLTASKEATSLAKPLKCVTMSGCSSPAEMAAENLPWNTQLSSQGSAVMDSFAGATLWVSCTVFGVKTSEECTMTNGSFIVSNAVGGVQASGEVTPLGNCTIGGTGSGAMSFVPGNLMTSLAGTLSVAAKLPPAPQLESVDFEKNANVIVDNPSDLPGQANVKVDFDGESAEWRKPEGSDKTTKNWPIVYPQNTRLELKATFHVEQEAREFLEKDAEGNVTVTGKMMLGTTKLTLSKSLTVAEVVNQLKAGDSFVIPEKSDVAIPAGVRLYQGVANGGQIVWEWSVKEKGQPNPIAQDVGSDELNLYVTRAAPLANVETFLTLLDAATLGIEKEKQPPTEGEAIAGVWRAFSPRSLNLRLYAVESGALARNGNVLTYWSEVADGGHPKGEEQVQCQAATTKELLNKEQGQCGAWALAFAETLASEGLHSSVLELKAQFKSQVAGKEEECVNAGVCFFLVKNWAFQAGGGAKKGAEFPYVEAEVTAQLGLPAQGVANPPSAFYNHFIVEARNQENVNETENLLYDPSYGTGAFKLGPAAEPLKEYQEKSIAGICAKIGCQQTTATSPPKLVVVKAQAF
jgi:hypothetical protein